MKADVLVVGGGLIGCACAYSLAKRGVRVALVEREDIASGASGACDGHVCCQSKTPGVHLDLALRSLSLYRTLDDELGESTGFRQCGSWLVAETAAELDALSAAVAQVRSGGLAVETRSGREVRAAEPALTKGLAGGSFCATDGQTDPWRTTLAFYHAAKRLGVQFRLGEAVVGLRAHRNRVRGVETATGRLEAGTVLLATGAWTAGLCAPLGVSLPVVPRRGEILVAEPMPRMLSSIILHAPYLASKQPAADTRPATLVLEQTEEGNLLVGSTRSSSDLDTRATISGITSIAAEANRLVPALRDLSVIRSFSGLRPASPDGLPLLGPVPDLDGLFVATGHEGDGIALAPVTAEIVGEGLVGGMSAWREELLPRRLDGGPR